MTVARERRRAAVVHEHHVHLVRAVRLLGTARARQELRVHGELLSGARAREQVQQHGEIAIGRNELFDADDGDVTARRRQAKARIALVRDEHHATAFGRNEVRACDAGVGDQVLFP